ncbi:MAG TPA: xanthine dehydrogenase family protein molybdopterin-binding subunit [Caulobacteraceae bacterium]|nr:xanthine dehydrogenase family protein molybdopterin-binding subunit [Caulobacteraceae bacterium]
MNASVTDLSVSRRALLIVAASASGGALLVGCSPASLLSIGEPKRDFGPFGPFVRIDRDGSVTVVNKHIEFGQGSHAGLAAIVAEELDADWDKVKVVQAPADAKVYANLSQGVQATGGSSAISNSWDQLRLAGAAARAMFLQAAAARFSVSAAELTIKDGVVSHPSGRQASFAELLPDAAKIKPPQAPALKDPAKFTLIGTNRVRRKDSVAKSTGTARFTQDVHLPNMLTSMVAHPKRFGAKPKSFDDAAARQVPGVVDVFVIPTGVAVVANNTWAARRGRDALSVQWDEAKAETRGTDALADRYRALSAWDAPTDAVKWQSFESRPPPAGTAAGPLVEAAYDFPYLAHAPMEPMNCVAEIGGGKLKLTVGSQVPTLDQMNTALIAGALPGSVEIEQLFAGGSFGRRANFKSDYVSECVHIAKHVGGGRPVKLVWTREDDMTAGYYRPLTHHRLKVELGADGLPHTWTHRVVSQSIMKGSPIPVKGLDPSVVEGAEGSPYFAATPYVVGEAALMDVGVPVLWWRSVGATHNAFVMEHTVDQLARRAGRDPVDYRRALYAKAGPSAARHLAALNLAAEKAPWGKPTAGWTRGVAVHESFGSVVAQIAEVKLDGAMPRVGRVVTAIDCGIAISPDQIAAQMEGGTCLGLAAALYGAIDMTDGVVQQQNFDGYRVLRMNEAPYVETYIVPSGARPSGVGEPGTPVIAPAVANALLAITGKPTTSLPLVKGA